MDEKPTSDEFKQKSDQPELSNKKLGNPHLVDGKYSIKDLVDIESLRKTLEKFSLATGFTTGFVEYPSQEILIGTGWRDICTKFHRPCPESAKHCKESNIYLSKQLRQLKELNIKPCENGLVDGATPIVIKGKYIAYLATGQILFEEPDIERFKKQAEMYGYDLDSYMEALSEVPVVSEDQFKNALFFLSELAVTIAEIGLNNLELKEKTRDLEEEIIQREKVEETLRESEDKYRTLTNNLNVGIYRNTAGPKGKFIEANPAIVKLFGHESREEFLKLSVSDLYQNPDNRKRFNAKMLQNGAVINEEEQLIRKDGISFIASISAVAVKDEKGEARYYDGILEDITERKKIEEALRESESKLSAMLAAIGDHMSMMDKDLNILWANDIAKKIFGNDIIGKKCYEIFHGRTEPCEPYPCITLKTFKDGMIHEHEAQVTDQKGETVFFHSTASVALRDKEGRPAAVLDISKDITERKKAESELRESEERYRSLFKNNHSAMLLVDPKTADIIDANPAAVTFYGWSREELISMKITDINTLTNEQVFQEMERAKTQNRQKFYFCHRLANGHICDVEVNSGPITVRGTELLYSIIYDITERKQTEDALRESEEKYRLLIDNLPNIVFKGYKDGAIDFIDDKIELLMGYKKDEFNLRKLNWLDIVVEEDKEGMRQTFIEALKTDKSYVREYRVKTKTGDILWIQEGSQIVCDEDGEIKYIGGAFIDITRHKKLESQLQQLDRIESIGTLAGGVAHDFNNLLMGIQGRASLMLVDSDASHPHFEHLKGIEDYIKSAADLTRQLLGFARGGKYEVKPTELNTLINNEIRMFGRTRKEINIQEKFEQNLWMAEVDQRQIQQVLLNIYVNAWQAMPGGGNLYIQTENVIIDEAYIKPYQVEPGNYVKVSITDNGVGMDEATRQRIFDPFFTTREMGRGTGLGLASAYGIIKNHNGFINVYSEKGEGTTFNIYLPASGKEAVKAKEIDEELITGTEIVLLVDDEDIIIEVGQEIIEKLGYEVLTAKSGKEAIEIYEKAPDRIDLVILDMIMPGMGGGDTYDQLKEINPEIKVLLSSGYSVNGQAAEILERGCNGFIQKPFNIANLSKKIRAILDKD